MLKQRIISSVLLILVSLASIILDYKFNLWFCDFLIIVLITAGLYEFYRMLELKGIRAYKYFAIAIGMLIPLSLIFNFELTKNWELFFVVLALLFLILMQFRRRQNEGVIVDISTTIFGILYVSWFFSFLIRIKYFDYNGMSYLSALLLITKLGDIGAYLIGSRFGKRPLLPSVSPNKSVEGAVGGLIFSVIGALISGLFLKLNFFHLLGLGIFLGIIGQFGDLSESLIKRDCRVKDSGQVFPGMGGVLDSIDSLLFTAPTFYFYLGAVLRA